MTDTTPTEAAETPEAMEARIRAELAAQSGPIEPTPAPAPAVIAPEPAPLNLGKTPIGEPVRVFKRRESGVPALEAWQSHPDRAHVFSTEDEDGHRIDYTMPAKPNPSIMLRFMQLSRTVGDAAMVDLFRDTLVASEVGAPSAFDALIAETEGMDGDEALALMRDLSSRIQLRLSGGMKR